MKTELITEEELFNLLSKEIGIDVLNGADYPDNLSDYDLIVHCGGCMMTRRVMQVRIKQAKLMEMPIVNYGLLISYMLVAIPCAIFPFEEAKVVWENL